MPRSILDEAHIHPAIRDQIAGLNADIVKEVQVAVAQDLARLHESGELKKLLA